MHSPDCPKSLADPDERAARTTALAADHMQPLTAFVRRLRLRSGQERGVPDFDPLDGGVTAECLLLLEAPGAKAKGSGFVSRNNPDETAQNIFLLNAEAGLARGRTITWNIVPWYVGSETKIRAVNTSDLKLALPYLEELLGMLPRLRAIVLVGRKAQRARKLIECLSPRYRIFACPHPSPLCLNGRPQRRQEILRCLCDVVNFLELPAEPDALPTARASVM